MKGHGKSVGNGFQCSECEIPFTTLYGADVGTVQAAAVCKFVLTPTSLLPVFPNPSPDRLLNILHTQQFAGTLLLCILLMKSLLISSN